MQKIDLTGFINEEIELVLDDSTFLISTDPDVESYVYLLHFLNGKFEAEEYIDIQRKLIITLIVNNANNLNVDIAKIKDKLGPTAIEQFMKAYLDILIKKGVLENKTQKKKNQKTKNPLS